jgi:succinate-semialdehyde dehydrogenase/glutarate-semialdehyde dehydrogenase
MHLRRGLWRWKKLKVGNGLEEGVDVGPLVDDQAVRKVEEHEADTLAKEASA